jgi:hypothetical protein
MNPSTDPLSAAARAVLRANVGGAYTRLVVHDDGADAHPVPAELTGLTPDTVLSAPPKSRDDAAAMLAGLWLWHDALDASHRISQSLHTASASFWHAIMHRREGDFSNSQYWYARCANHPALPTLAAQAQSLINTAPADKSILRLAHHGWDADAFVDLVSAVHDKSNDPRHALAVALQQLEWRVLFDHCTRAAAGAGAGAGANS